MIKIIKKIGYFFHITDGKGQLDLVDIAFMAVMCKILLAKNFDWASMAGLIGLLIGHLRDDILK